MTPTALTISPAGIEPHKLALLANHVAEIKRLGRRMVSDAIEIGRRLDACKFIVGHGNWTPWLDENFGWTDRTAQNLINVYLMTTKTKSENFSDLSLPLSALYLLASPSTPPEAIDEIVARADRGEATKLADVKETIGRHKDKKRKRAPKLKLWKLQARAERIGWTIHQDGGKFALSRPDNNPDLCPGADFFYSIPTRLRDAGSLLDEIEASPDPANYTTDEEPIDVAPPTIDAEPVAAAPISTGGAFDYEKLKKQIVDSTRDLGAFVKAGPTPAQAEEIAKLMEALAGSFEFQEAPYDELLKIVAKNHDRKRYSKEAKNPQKILDAARKQEQQNEMIDDIAEAKREARESGDLWSDIKEEWEAEWLEDNWDDKREQDFLATFKSDWKDRHGQKFPGSDFADGDA